MRLVGLVLTVVLLVAIVVPPVQLALAQAPPPNPTRSLPDKVERGATFNVTVNFAAPADNFNGISLRDTAPAGWNVIADATWCDPDADGAVVVGGNQIQLGWIGPYNNGTNFTAKYKVTVPCSASVGNYSFSVNYPNETMFRWHIENDLYSANIAGDYVLEVIGPTINFTPTSIDFYGAVNGTNPQNQSLELWSSTPCLLNWSLSDGAAWLNEDPASGSSTGEHDTVAVSVDITGMSAGDYSANITITAPGVSNSLQTVPVSLYVGEISPSPPVWLSRYWWPMVAGMVVVVLSAYFLRRRRGR